MKPALTFTPQMFAAVLAGKKDVTRRIVTAPTSHGMIVQGHTLLSAATGKEIPGPYGPPGTVLPIVTTWAAHQAHNSRRPKKLVLLKGTTAKIHRLWFDDGTPKPSWAGKNRPARFLPKSLYHLAPQVQIVSTRAEPLRDITNADAMREGAEPDSREVLAHRAGFKSLWDSINADRHDGLYAWSKNPMVWRIEFKLL